MRDIRSVIIVGAGTMGYGIAQDFACAGFDVTLYDLARGLLEQAVEQIHHNLTEMVEWGLVQPADV